MSVSSIPASSPTPPNYLNTNTQPASPPAAADNDSSDAGAAQPSAPAPLPPGQGTRVDQLV
jgi:hypothetical protein